MGKKCAFILVFVILVCCPSCIVVINNDNTQATSTLKPTINTLDELKKDKDTRKYRIVYERELTEDYVNRIVHNLKRRAEFFSDKPLVAAEKDKDEWVIYFKIPNANDDTYMKVMKDHMVYFIGGYGTDREEIILSNTDIAGANTGLVTNLSGMNEIVINLTLNDNGRMKFKEGTEKYLGGPITIVFDNEVIGAPIVREIMSDGKAQIVPQEGMNAEEMAFFISASLLECEFEMLK